MIANTHAQTTHAHTKTSIAQLQQSRYTQLTPHYDRQHELMWYYMRPSARPCFSPQLLNDIREFQEDVTRMFDSPTGKAIRYLVLASDVPGVFNLGGDLELFRQSIIARDRGGLLRYAKACIEVLYANIINLDRDLTTVSLVQGDALGGGFEAALSSNVLIAERSAKLGLPEVLFNLFPGMGAYSLLSRKVGGAQAERMILSGKLYSAEELYETGLVDVLAEDGQGEMAVYEYIKRENRSRNGFHALREAKRVVNPITYEELMQVTEVWVNAALNLTHKDLRMMERLVGRQTEKTASVA